MDPKTKDRLLFLLGVTICFAVAAVSVLLEGWIPGGILGASIIALFMGTIINSFFHPGWMKPALKFTSKKILKLAIILLGASLSVNTILSVGKMTFFVMIFTFAVCFGGGYFVRKLFGLNWKQRLNIIVGTARGLAYLHQEFHVCIIHRDIKTNNILLDDQFEAKIGDFGLARLLPNDLSHLSTRFAGTL